MDCIVIGGGPAGLTAGIYLRRFRRKVAVVDNRSSRARLIPKTHNYPGFAEGVSGSQLLERLGAQAEAYGVSLIVGDVKRLRRAGGRFEVHLSDRELSAARVIIATGLVDKTPATPRLEEAVAAGLVRFCPICDGFEASDLRIAVLGRSSEAYGKALFLRTYSKSITLLALDDSTLEGPIATELEEAGIVRPVAPVASIDHGSGAVTVTLANTECLAFDTLYPVLGCEVRSGLAAALGASHNEIGCLLVDQHQQTSVAGLCAIGDVVSDLHQIAFGTGHATVAAAHLHQTLPRNLKS